MNIVERLRQVASGDIRIGPLPAHTLDTAGEAADEIERLRVLATDDQAGQSWRETALEAEGRQGDMEKACQEAICAAEAAAREEEREACAAMRAGLVEIRRRLVEMPGVTCGMNDVIDHALGSVECDE